ncbi:MAG: efflux RND transporter periplasmic adaptor subunit [Acidobacteriota bacterium]
MSKGKRIVLVVVAIGVVAALLFWKPWRAWQGPRDVLEMTGNLELTQAELGFKIPGKIAELHVDEGDPVEAGQLVARLDDRELRAALDEVSAQLQVVQSQMKELRALLHYQEENLAALLRQRDAEIERAAAVLAQLEEGSRPQEIAAARAAVQAAEAEFARAEADWNRAQELVRNEDISRAQFDQFAARYRQAQAALEEARQRLSLVEEGPRSQEIEAARAAVAQARAGRAAAEAGRWEIERNRTALQTLQAQEESLAARRRQLEARLADTELYAPFSGVVLVKSAEVGEIVAAGTPVFTIGDLANPWVRAYVPETVIGRVRLGGPARISADSFPGRVFSGRISFIASEAEFTPKQIESREERVKMVYRIKIDVPNPTGELKLNMPVDVEIPLQAEETS